ncbi:MAG TPA: hypothetical protein DEQ09_01285, partial [Bacteroidales bacterium]|nr:hypothetical protein [Bacteroidales bacterium]
MTRFWQISFVLGILMSLLPISSSSQSEVFLKPLRVAAGSYVSINDSLVYFMNDTIIYVSDSYMPQDTNVYNKTIIFYDSLKARASKKNITKLLYDLVVIPPSRDDYNKNRERNIYNFTAHRGKRIRHILFRRLNAFGSTINHPETSLEKEGDYLLNKTHNKTKEYIINKYLLFKEKDSLVPLKISESERLLRKLPYIHDARIIVIPVSSDEVDLMVITKDVYSLGLNTDIKYMDVGKISIFNKNLFGLGHALEVEIPYNYRDYNSTGIGASYTLKNISRSLIDLKLEYKNA